MLRKSNTKGLDSAESQGNQRHVVLAGSALVGSRRRRYRSVRVAAGKWNERVFLPNGGQEVSGMPDKKRSPIPGLNRQPGANKGKRP